MMTEQTQQEMMTAAKQDLSDGRYIETVGRRKRATARIRLFASKGKQSTVTIDDAKVEEYFPVLTNQIKVEQPFGVEGQEDVFTVTVKVHGGGKSAQAEAVRHGIARAIAEFNPALRTPLKRAGYLKRDPRKKERKKFGLRKARKSPQWSKR